MCVCVWESGSSFSFIGTNHYKTQGLSGGLLDFLLMGWQVILSANLIERKWLRAMVHIRFHPSLHCIYLQVTCRAPGETRDGKPFHFMSVYGGWEIRACTFKPVWSTESRGPVPRKAVILPLMLPSHSLLSLLRRWMSRGWREERLLPSFFLSQGAPEKFLLC